MSNEISSITLSEKETDYFTQLQKIIEEASAKAQNAFEFILYSHGASGEWGFAQDRKSLVKKKALEEATKMEIVGKPQLVRKAPKPSEVGA